jgi:hypothetical protein
MKSKAVDPVFAEYARTAPLEDLRFNLRYAERRLAEYELGDRTVQIIGEMRGLEQELTKTGTVPGGKAKVAHLIACFKSSIPGFAGAAGRRNGWITDDDVYARFVKKARGPIPAERFAAACAKAHAKAEAVNGFRVVRRAVTLSVEEVQAMLGPAPEPAETTPQSVKAPTWRARALAAEAALKIALAAKPRGARTVISKATGSPVDWRAAGLKAAETRRRNAAARAVAA